jgi:hypothetical protein
MQFQTWFVVGILRFQKWFDVDILGFQIVDIYVFLSCRLFGLLFEKLGKFVSNLLVSLTENNICVEATESDKNFSLTQYGVNYTSKKVLWYRSLKLSLRK